MTDYDNMTPEEIFGEIKKINARAAKEIERSFFLFADSVAGMGIIRSYLKQDEQDFLRNMKRMSGTLNGRIDKLLDTIYVVVSEAYKQTWTTGEALGKSVVRTKIGDRKELFSWMEEKGAFSHRTKAMNKFRLTKSDFLISSRVWKEGIKGQIEDVLQLALSEGKSADQLSRDLRRYLREPDRLYRRVRDKATGELKLSKNARDYHPGQGVYRSSYKNALRLAENEINMAYRRSEREIYQNNPAIIGYNINLSNNHTCNGKPFVDICDYAQGVYPKDFVWTGWHIKCRCIMTPVFASQNDLNEMYLAILNGKDPAAVSTRRISGIPAKFKLWSASHKDQISGWKSKPHYISDNPKYAKYFI